MHQIPDLFRSEGYSVTTIQDEYGQRTVPDERWLHDSGVHQWVVLTKDERIRRRPSEIHAFVKAKARVVCLTPGSLTMAQQVEYFRVNLKRLESWWNRPGPWLLAVRGNSIEQLELNTRALEMD
ncbi:MAG: hypothetical protein FWG16_05910 [Micrococcales bacterium]|nr:hypothetical protein [Micrococcales bacterium]